MSNILFSLITLLVVFGFLSIIFLIQYIIDNYSSPIQLIIGKNRVIDNIYITFNGEAVYTIYEIDENNRFMYQYIDGQGKFYESSSKFILVLKFFLKIK